LSSFRRSPSPSFVRHSHSMHQRYWDFLTKQLKDEHLSRKNERDLLHLHRAILKTIHMTIVVATEILGQLTRIHIERRRDIIIITTTTKTPIRDLLIKELEHVRPLMREKQRKQKQIHHYVHLRQNSLQWWQEKHFNTLWYYIFLELLWTFFFSNFVIS
jgi:hypothetical protein